MENIWIIYILIYAMAKGVREGIKKSATTKSPSEEILFFYTLIGFIMILPFSPGALSLAPKYIFWIFVKSLVCCVAFACAICAIKNMSLSLFGITDLSRMVFSTLLSVFILGESFTLPKGIGIGLVITGLLLANLKKTASSKGVDVKSLVLVLVSCFLNATSGIMDKVYMRDFAPAQMQFWFMLFMTVIYGMFFAVKKADISLSRAVRNWRIPLMSLSLVVGDRLLFAANASPYSEVTVMTVIKQSSVIVSVLCGWLFFREKNIPYKLMCAAIVLSGVLVTVLVK